MLFGLGEDVLNAQVAAAVQLAVILLALARLVYRYGRRRLLDVEPATVRGLATAVVVRVGRSGLAPRTL